MKKVTIFVGALAAGAVGLVEAGSHGAFRSLSKLGRGVVAATESDRAPVNPLAAFSPAGWGQATQATIKPSSTPPPQAISQELAAAQSPEEAAKLIPGAVAIGGKWLVASAKSVPQGGDMPGCMAVTKDGANVTIFYMGKGVPFSVFVSGEGWSRRTDLNAEVTVLLASRRPERFAAQQAVRVGPYSMVALITDAEAPPLVAALRQARSMTVTGNGSQWEMPLTYSDQALRTLQVCAART